MKKITTTITITVMAILLNGCTGGNPYQARYLNEPVNAYSHSFKNNGGYTSYNHRNGVTHHKSTNIGY